MKPIYCLGNKLLGIKQFMGVFFFYLNQEIKGQYTHITHYTNTVV